MPFFDSGSRAYPVAETWPSAPTREATTWQTISEPTTVRLASQTTV